MNERNFFAELKRRNVYKVAVAYAVVGWVVAQIATQIFPFLEIPNWIVRLVIVLIAIGFPIALVIAWAFEATPEGIKRTEDVDALLATNVGVAASTRQPRKHAWIFVVFIGVALSIGLFFIGRYTGRNTAGATGSDLSAKSIAVLPFESLSEDKANAYFADGIQDEILTKLASIADLKVISRTSTAKYKSKPEDLKTVSQQLGVAHVLEGTVQKAGDKVRINVQLIDARVDAHIWAKSYDGDAKDIFGVESEVSQQIADALRAKLSPSESKTLAKAPTQDPEAYDLFLKGEYERRQGEGLLTAEWFERAAGYYREALNREPNFALAAARLAESRLSLHFYSRPLSPTELDDVKSVVDRALALDPELAESHEALGLFYYWGHLNYEAALVEFRRALQLQPNNARARGFCGFVYRRQGKWKDSLEELAKAEALDPRDAQIPGNTALSYTSLRYWAEAKRAGSRALAVDPHYVSALRSLVIAAIHGNGDIAGARSAIANAPGSERLIGNIRGGLLAVIDYRPYLDILDRKFEAASRSVPDRRDNDFDRRATLSARAAIEALAGTAASPESEDARKMLETRLRERPDDNLAMTQLSWVYLALGRRADAVRLAQQAADSLPIEKDALAGPSFAVGLAEIEARSGETSAAIEGLRRLLGIPAGNDVSLKRLQIDPVWDPIRNDPAFQQLLTIKEHVGP